jgi:hypothetical protein
MTFLSFKNYVNVASTSTVISKKLWEKIILVAFLKVTDENSRIRSRILSRIRNRSWIQIRIHLSEVQILGSGSVLEFHGSQLMEAPIYLDTHLLHRFLNLSFIKSNNL